MGGNRMNINKWNYISSSNYGAHTIAVTIGGLTLWFSYDTVIAFRPPGGGIRVCENIWSVTTGKHLNSIDGGRKKERLSWEEFDKELTKTLKKHKLTINGR